jgi:hypothetical protein
MNSDTPRTDNAALHGDGTTVPADFAADLECEIAELKAEVERANADLVAYRAEANALEEVVRRLNDEHRAEVERLREVLEWIATHDLHGADLTVCGHMAHGFIGKARDALKETK